MDTFLAMVLSGVTQHGGRIAKSSATSTNTHTSWTPPMLNKIDVIQISVAIIAFVLPITLTLITGELRWILLMFPLIMMTSVGSDYDI